MYQRNPFLKKAYRFNRPIKNKSPESQLVMQIIHYLRAKNKPCGKTKTRGLFNKQGQWCADPYLFTGFPDITVFTPRLIFIEAKSLTGKQSEEQKTFQSFCEKAGIPYILARRLEDVTEVIK